MARCSDRPRAYESMVLRAGPTPNHVSLMHVSAMCAYLGRYAYAYDMHNDKLHNNMCMRTCTREHGQRTCSQEHEHKNMYRDMDA